MAKLRKTNPKKELLLKSVWENPGLGTAELAKLSGVPMWSTIKILPELAGLRLICVRALRKTDPRTRRWFPNVTTETMDNKCLSAT